MADTISNPSPATADVVNELLLIEQLGIPAKKIRALRPANAVQGPDGVLWPLAAATALAMSMGAELAQAEKKSPADGIEELTVHSTARGTDGRHFTNPNVIQACRANGEVVTVRVVHSGKYRPTLRINGEPMTLKARRANGGNWWVLVGREPRYPAQW